MKLSSLISALQEKHVRGETHMDISSIVMHSHNAGPGTLFVAIPGLKADGHAYLETAYQSGARAFVTQKPFRKVDAVNIVVPDSRVALAVLAAEFFGNPSLALTLIGITGTNGKTTTAFLMESILKEAGYPVGLLTTIAYRFQKLHRQAERTTPDQLTIQHMFREMVAAGIHYAVMEVSSHGLDQRRVEDTHFDVGIFTNLSPEHLDYHSSMDTYYKSKERFFTELLAQSSKKNRVAVINQDDPMGSVLAEKINYRTVRFGCEQGDIHTVNTTLSLQGITADIITPKDHFTVSSALIGTFNLYNILAAAAAATVLGIPASAIKAGIEKVPAVAGRMERIDNQQGIIIFVDYAHTGDALENVLKTLKKTGAERIITIFGCGGDRDRTKRPVMGRIAAHYSAVVIITSDNPRSEQPERIIAEIEKGVIEKGFTKAEHAAELSYREKIYFIVSDRKAAIQSGINMAQPDTVVLIAGKGHETYQEVGAIKTHFDDREEARYALQMST